MTEFLLALSVTSILLNVIWFKVLKNAFKKMESPMMISYDIKTGELSMNNCGHIFAIGVFSVGRGNDRQKFNIHTIKDYPGILNFIRGLEPFRDSDVPLEVYRKENHIDPNMFMHPSGHQYSDALLQFTIKLV